MLARVVTSLAMSLPVAAPIAGYFTWKLSSKVAASKRASTPSPIGKSLSSRKGSSSSLRSRGVDVGTAAAGPESATTGTDAFAPTTASRGSQIKAAAVDAGSSTPRRIAAAAGSQTSAGIDAPSPRGSSHRVPLPSDASVLTYRPSRPVAFATERQVSTKHALTSAAEAAEKVRNSSERGY